MGETDRVSAQKSIRPRHNIGIYSLEVFTKKLQLTVLNLHGLATYIELQISHCIIIVQITHDQD